MELLSPYMFDVVKFRAEENAIQFHMYKKYNVSAHERKALNH